MLRDVQTFAALYDHLKKLPENETFLNHLEKGEWQAFSKTEFLDTVRYLSLTFAARGWRNKKIAIAIRPSSYWLMIDYALMLCGAVSVPLFITISANNLRFELENCDVSTVFVQTEAQKNAIASTGRDMTCIHFEAQNPRCEAFRSLVDEGRAIDEKDPAAFGQLLAKITPGTLLTIVHTSGTSGVPKGAQLTHANLISQLVDSKRCFTLNPQSDKALSVLPLAHIFERMVMHYYLSQGISVYFVDEVKNIASILRHVRPTLMTVVPRLLEKVYFRMLQKAQAGPWLKRRIAGAAFERAKHKDPEKPATLADRLFERLVYAKLRDSMGGHLRMMISGGAALSRSLNRFYLNIGMPLYQGYGLTEASPVICTNAPGRNKIGTCGKSYVHTEVKTAGDGELLARGPGIMQGYINDPEATAEAVDREGWLHTGDLASIDSEGYVTITGRKKELAKTSTGEYISVHYIEQALTACGWLDYAMVIGNGRPFVTVLLMLEPHAIREYARLHGYATAEEAAASASFGKHMERLVGDVNRNLNEWERIRKYHLVTEKLTVEKGEITPSMKLVRGQIEARFQKAIEQMYGGHI